MAKRVVLAVAGAGKTFHICREIDLAKKNLILAYTHENIKNIHRELMAKYGKIPPLTSVMTFDSFVYRFLVCPYIPTIASYFNCDSFEMSGITLSTPPVPSILMSDGTRRKNRHYEKVDKLGHYFNRKRQIYNEYTSKLVMRSKNRAGTLIDKAAQELNRFYDQRLSCIVYS